MEAVGEPFGDVTVVRREPVGPRHQRLARDDGGGARAGADAGVVEQRHGSGEEHREAGERLRNDVEDGIGRVVG